MSEVIEPKLADGARLERWNHREIGLSPAELKLLYQRRDALGLIYFGGWLCLTGGAGFLYYLSFATYWVVPALMLYGTILALAYAMSHETAHGTAFRTRWLNEAVFWFTSFIYGQEPNYRRYSHATHHAYTGMYGLDAQMPWQHPMTLGMYLKKISGYSEIVGFPTVWIRHALGDIPDRVKEFTPEKKWPRLIWGARLFLGAHAALKAVESLDNLHYVLAIELICAVQAVDLRAPLAPAAVTAAVRHLVRQHIPFWQEDRLMHGDIEAAKALIQAGRAVQAAEAVCGPLC